MLFHKAALLVTLSAGCLAAPANDLVARQGEGQITYTVTCIGPRCSNSPSTSIPKTSTKVSSSYSTSKSTISTVTSKSTPKPTPTPTPTKVSFLPTILPAKALERSIF
ncbi:hypothetical protein GRF29_19g3051592 [Pseudopithomyces chartarum]|uniref:Uncharacterized protein n=1 Tax=Pseudopithomyces chartarum TaxID=1892770 RepID=A0AAN6RKT0_9PLEO|nr:hypothetical protein GRF29_19g3051592 [Pseudopithomyces chartarum]